VSHESHRHDGHAHAHGPHAHDHRIAVAADNERRIFWVMLLTAGFTVAQAVGGWLSGSLALIADAGHMLSDSAALGLAWLAFRLGRRPADARRSYGYYRFEILAALINGLALIVVAIWVCYEAWHRLREPVAVLGGPMLAVAVVGLAVNVVGFLILRRAERENVTLKSALVHVVGDLLGSIATIAAAIVILATGWMPIDPLLSVLVALLIVRSAWDIVRRSGHVLMEGSPEGFDARALRADLVAHVPGIRGVHHVHAWMITAERPMVTLHLELEPGADAARIMTAAKERLKHEYGFGHSTIQIDPAGCPD
jgi:cobalt-zinc-cadmium efflux system protein